MSPYSNREERIGHIPILDQFSFRANQGPEVAWTDPQLAEVIRLRLVAQENSDEPEYEILYCHGRLANGQACRVRLPFNTLPKRRDVRDSLGHRARCADLHRINRSVYLSLFSALSTMN